MQPQTTARAEAVHLLSQVLQHHRTLDEAPRSAGLSDSDAAFAMHLTLSVLRHLGQIDTLIAGYLEKALPAKRWAVQHALRIGVAQLLLMDTPPHAAVNESVKLVKQGKEKALAGLVNAVLKKIARDLPKLPDATCNLPLWLRERWRKQYGDAVTRDMTAIAAELPPLDLNTRQRFEQGVRLDEVIWRMRQHKPVAELEGYADGKFFVQDVAASYPVRLLGNVKDLTVLDIGAAPGGKTMQLAQGGAVVTALDKSAKRMTRVQENLTRMQLTAELVVEDALRFTPRHLFDAVLLDAPCSATGTWRRHPELVQVTKESDVTQLAVTQRALLERAWSYVKEGGRLVYCTCSLEPEEGEDQAVWFGEQHPEAKLIPSSLPQVTTEEGYVRTRPDMLADAGGMDGFFAVMWQKQ